jgi:hypothetical protein
VRSTATLTPAAWVTAWILAFARMTALVLTEQRAKTNIDMFLQERNTTLAAAYPTFIGVTVESITAVQNSPLR